MRNHTLPYGDETIRQSTRHKPVRFEACQSALYPQVVVQGVLACLRGRGAVFNGGDTGSSKPLETHIARGSCRDRRPHAPSLELNGPFLATSIAGVYATLAQAAAARFEPHLAPPHAAAIEFCHQHPAFTPIHLRTSGCKSIAALPKL